MTRLDLAWPMLSVLQKSIYHDVRSSLWGADRSKIVVQGGGECVGEALRVLDHFVERLIALLDERIIVLDFAVLRLDVELAALAFPLQLGNLLVQVGDLHAHAHRLLVDLVATMAQLLHLAFELVKVVVVCHCKVFLLIIQDAPRN